MKDEIEDLMHGWLCSFQGGEAQLKSAGLTLAGRPFRWLSTMPDDPAETTLTSIDEALEYCITQAEGDGILLQEALNRLGPASFCFLSLLLSIPFIQPISLGPFTMASGITFMVVDWQMARGHGTPALPARTRGWKVHGKGWLTLLRVCRRTLVFCRKFTKPRLASWLGSDRQTGWLILIGGFLLALPCFNLPLNNTIPAIMILFAALAWLERDGLMVLVSLIFGGLTVLYFIVVYGLICFFGVQILGWVKSHLPSFLG